MRQDVIDAMEDYLGVSIDIKLALKEAYEVGKEEGYKEANEEYAKKRGHPF